MRLIFFTSILLLVAFLPIQKSFSQASFQSRYILQHNVGGSKIFPLPNKGSLVVAYSQTDCGLIDNCRYYLNANRIDNKGVLLWHKTYSTEYSAYGFQSLVTKDGGFAFFQNLTDTVSGNYVGGLLVKCNAGGGVQWAKQIVSQTYVHFEPYVLAQDDDGNLLLFYSVAKNQYASSVLQIVKVSPTGNMLWYKTLQTTSFGYTYYVANSFKQVRDKYIIAGEFNNQYFEGLLSSNLLVIDTSGRISKFREIDINGLPSTLYNTSALYAFPNGNELYVLGTYTNNEPQIGSRYYLLPLTDTTTSTAGILLPYSDFSLQHYLSGYKNAFPFSYYYSSFAKNGSYTTLAVESGYRHLLQYDSLGRLCPNYALSFVDSQVLTKQFKVTDNSEYRILKDSVYLMNKKVFVSSDSISYDVVCGGSASIVNNLREVPLPKDNIQKKGLLVYPNPAHNVINISGLQKKASVTFLSSTGITIKAVSLSGANGLIPVSGLAKGIYFLRVCEQDKSPQVFSFIKE